MDKQVKLISLKQAGEKTGGISGRHLLRMAEEKKFPKPVRVTEGSPHRMGRIAFVESEIEEWISARIAERQAEPPKQNPRRQN